MSDLYPTPTRLALLREVAAERITRSLGSSYDRHGFSVTARMIEMRQAGWVVLVDLSGDFQYVWKLTDAGRAVLDGAS
jgi:hypothetical protein